MHKKIIVKTVFGECSVTLHFPLHFALNTHPTDSEPFESTLPPPYIHLVHVVGNDVLTASV